jgi:RNase adapter protein RapZ
MQLVLISGLSGSGKSIALHVLEDAGYYCVDNLPATLLPPLVRQLREEGYERVAVAIDVRAGTSIAALPQQLRDLQALGVPTRFVFLEARDETLIARFSETRRGHPLSNADTTLAEAIVRERGMLENIAGLGNRIDTSSLNPNALRAWILDFVQPAASQGLTLLFESFGYKHGIPLDADLVFDVRCLPNPHYDPVLRPLTGRDPEVARFLETQAEVRKMAEDIRRFLAEWLPSYVRDNRSYLTVAIGCTGGQHRSVYLAEWLAGQFCDRARVLVRHRAIT